MFIFCNNTYFHRKRVKPRAETSTHINYLEFRIYSDVGSLVLRFFYYHIMVSLSTMYEWWCRRCLHRIWCLYRFLHKHCTCFIMSFRSPFVCQLSGGDSIGQQRKKNMNELNKLSNDSSDGLIQRHSNWLLINKCNFKVVPFCSV